MFRKQLLENEEMVFTNGVINLQATGYNGTHTFQKQAYLYNSNVENVIILRTFSKAGISFQRSLSLWILIVVRT